MYKKYGKLICILVSIFLVVALLGACAKDDPKDTTKPADPTPKEATVEPTPEPEEITLEVITYYGGGILLELLEKTIEVYEDKYPHVTVEHTGFTSSHEMAQTAKLAFDSGQGQHVIMVDGVTQRLLSRYDYLMDITDYVYERGWFDAAGPGALDLYTMMHPGTYYSVPSINSWVLAYYNKDLMEELTDELPQSFEEFNNLLYKAHEAGYVPLEKAGVDVFGLMWIKDWMIKNSAPYENFVKQYTLEETTDEFKEAFINALRHIDQWNKDGFFRENMLAISRADLPTLYAEGKSLFIVSGLWDLQNMINTEIPTGAMPIPKVDPSLEDHYAVAQPFGAWAVNADLSPEMTKAAIDFLDVLLSEEIAMMWYVESPYLPVTEIDTSKAQVHPLKEEAIQITETVKIGAFIDNAVAGIGSVTNAAIQQMLMGNMTPEEVWEEYISEYNKLKAEYKD